MAPRRVTLRTRRLLLEPVAPRHADGLHEATFASRAELLPWMPWAKDPQLGRARFETRDAELRWRAGSDFHFASIERGSGMVLGVVGVNRMGDESGELHYWIRSDHSGQGLTTEACRGVIAWSRRVLHLRKLTLWAGRDNHASRRVATKLGFVHLGPLDWEPEGGLGTFPAESYELVLIDSKPVPVHQRGPEAPRKPARVHPRGQRATS